jgi:hypothetical protein
MKDANAQGMIVWDIEGEQYPQATSYLGDPRSLPPEIEPLADEFFARFSAAGLRTGLTLRPTLPVRAAYGNDVRQIEVADIERNLDDKLTYARKRWGCSIFYVDSNGDPNLPIDPVIFMQLAQSHPDVLLVPEHQDARYYAYTAPYRELRLGPNSTPAMARELYPHAFSVIYIPDGNVEANRAALVAAVQAGDILLFRGWWTDPFNAAVKSIEQQAAG